MRKLLLDAKDAAARLDGSRSPNDPAEHRGMGTVKLQYDPTSFNGKLRPVGATAAR